MQDWEAPWVLPLVRAPWLHHILVDDIMVGVCEKDHKTIQEARDWVGEGAVLVSVATHSCRNQHSPQEDC